MAWDPPLDAARAHWGSEQLPESTVGDVPTHSVWCKSRSRVRNVRSDRRHGHCVMPGIGADDTVAKSTSFRHFLLTGCSRRVPSVRALRRPRGKIARDRS